MSSTMAMWDYATPYVSAINLTPRATRTEGTCARCGCEIPPSTSWGHVPKRYCSERCRKRAERARWKAKWKQRGVNKYVGGLDK